MTHLNRQQILKKILRSPSFIIVGSIGLLLFSQLFSVIVLSILPSDNYSDSIKVLINLVAIALAMAGMIATSLQLYGGDKKSVGFLKPKKSWIKLSVASVVLYLIFSTALIFLTSIIFSNFDPNQAQDVGIVSALTLTDKIAGFLALVILTPIIEEALFRGIIFRGLRLSGPFWLAAVVSSSLFALAHGQWNVALDTFVLGMVLSFMVERTKSIYPSITIHALKNSLAFVLLFVV